MIIVVNLSLMFTPFYTDDKKEIFSSTMSQSNYDKSKSNFSEIDDSAQFRSTKV